MKKKNRSVSHDGLGQAVCVVCLGIVAQQAVAQEPSGQSQQAVEEVTVTGTRLVTSGVNTPTPVTSVSSVDLQKMAPSTLIESLSQLPVFANNLASQQAVGGSVAAGGANLNLRGLDAPRRCMLLDGRRLGPSNKYGTVDVGVIPETLVRSVEAVTGGASAAYGADAVAGVVNFRLDRKLDGFKKRVPSRGHDIRRRRDVQGGHRLRYGRRRTWAHHRGHRDVAQKGDRRFQLPPGPQRLHTISGPRSRIRIPTGQTS